MQEGPRSPLLSVVQEPPPPPFLSRRRPPIPLPLKHPTSARRPSLSFALRRAGTSSSAISLSLSEEAADPSPSEPPNQCKEAVALLCSPSCRNRLRCFSLSRRRPPIPLHLKHTTSARRSSLSFALRCAGTGSAVSLSLDTGLCAPEEEATL